MGSGLSKPASVARSNNGGVPAVWRCADHGLRCLPRETGGGGGVGDVLSGRAGGRASKLGGLPNGRGCHGGTSAKAAASPAQLPLCLVQQYANSSNTASFPTRTATLVDGAGQLRNCARRGGVKRLA